MGFWPFQEGISTESRLATQGRTVWAASGVLGILKDLGYVSQVDVLGDVMGKEVGEDVSLGSAQPTLCLTAEPALEHSFAPMPNDVIVEDAQGFVINSTSKALDGLAIFPGRADQ